MNIDDLKDAWKKDDAVKTPSFYDLATGKTSSVITKVRRNMRNEFIATLFSYVILSGFLFRHPQAPMFFNLACIMLFALSLLTCYYFIRFYLFYKAMARYDIDLKQSISKAAYELELNTEIYKSFNLCTTPMTLVIAIGIVWGKKADLLLSILGSGFNINTTLYVFGSLLITFLAAYFFITLHIRNSYGKYLKELKGLIADLNHEEA